jgi:hypothetical protein
LPVSRFNKVFETARRVKRFLRNPKKAFARRLRIQENALRRRHMRSKRDDFKQLKSEVKSKRREDYTQLRNEIAEIEYKLKHNKQEIKLIGQELLAAKDPAQRREYEERKLRIQQERLRLRAELRAAKRKGRAANIGRKRKKKTMQQEIFQLERARRAALERQSQVTPDAGGPVPLTEGEPETGALPDFVIIGGKKCGTTFLYHLLAQHPLVEPAASKELHFFDNLYDEGVEWYQRCFPTPRLEDGRWTITGEASPSYLSHPHAAKRIAKVVPQAQLIALLRNPVDRAFSHYQMGIRRGFEHLEFKEAIEAEEARLHGESDLVLKDEHHTVFNLERFSYLSRGIYVDQLLRWSKLFGQEQMLVLKSEDFFEKPQETLAQVEDFLDLPYWVPEATKPRGERDKENYDRIKSNRGRYEEGMDPALRRRLEEYFEPHNRRLYDFLGVDFGW